MTRERPFSSRQYALMKMFAEDVAYANIERSMEIDQRPFRSLLIRGWLGYAPRRGFHLTQAGVDAWNSFRHAAIKRTDPTRPLTRYFDPTAYGLPENVYQKRALRVVAGRRHVA